MDNILEMDLSPEDGKLLKEALETWKEEVYAGLLEKVEQAKERKLEELEEAAIEYKASLKKEYSDKMVKTLKEMEKEIRAKVVAEVVAENPEIQVLEQIKELIAPTLNEDFAKNVYSEEIQTLREQLLMLEEKMRLEKGARELAELVSPYSRKTQNLIISLVKEGGPEEIREQFYQIMESLADEDEDDEEEDEDEDWDDEDDEDFEDDDEEDDDEEEEDDEDFEDDEEEDLDDEDDEDLDDEEDDEEDEEEMEESYKGSSVKSGKRGKTKELKENSNPLRDRMLNLLD